MADESVTRLPAEPLSPLAARVDEALARYGYEMRPVLEAVAAALPGMGGLFDPATTADQRRAALAEVVAAAPADPYRPDADPARVVLYVDGSSRGNPGPAGAGAVVRVDGRDVAALGRPVGARADNNVAEYAALQMGLAGVLARYGLVETEVRVDSRTVIDDVWGAADGRADRFEPYGSAAVDLLARLPAHAWTHLADSDPNPADARATVGADIAALGPG